jgi:spermidine synthase
VHDDGARYLEAGDEPFDVLLVDAFDADGVALSLVDERFHRAAARRLTEGGVIVTNLWGKTERYSDLLKQAARIYGSNATLVPVSGELNVLLFASRRAPPTSITDDLEAIANWLQRHLELDFPRYLRVICQGHTLVGT